MKRKNVLVTGGTGFVGRTAIAHLVARGFAVRAALREPSGVVPSGVEAVPVGNMGPATDWRAALEGCDAVVHLAARVHVMRDDAADPLAAFRTVNTDGTLNLARQAAEAGVERLVFVSTVKVHGEGRDAPYRETDAPEPQDAYAISKWEAEQGLHDIARDSGLQVVVLRPPLVYGPGAGANFLRLLRGVEQGLPLPLASVRNRRSLVYVGNLVDAIVRCVDDPRAAGQTFLVADDEALSTPQLIRALASASRRPARLWPFPPPLLRLVAAWSGRQAEVERLCGSLVVDTGHLKRTLDWTPPFTLAQGLNETVEWFRRSGSGRR